MLLPKGCKRLNENKTFCPKCKALTMEPAEGILLTKEEFEGVATALTFAGRLTPYKCPVCSFTIYEPVP